MNPLTLNALAIGIFVMTLSILLGPFFRIPAILPTSLTFIVLSAVTFDAFRFESLGLTVVLDTLAQLSPRYRHRVIHHEAGHFLVAYLLDLPIESYTLSVREALSQGPQGQAGVVLAQPPITQTQAWLRNNIMNLCTVWCAGGVAETLKFGSTQGNEDDLQQLRSTLKRLGLDRKFYERQAHAKAQQLIEQHWQSYEILVGLLAQRKSVVDCLSELATVSSVPSSSMSHAPQS